MRRSLELAKARGLVDFYGKEVSSDGEIGELLRKRTRALVLENVDAGRVALVAGLCGSRAVLAVAAGVAESDLEAVLEKGISEPIDPVEVDEAPCQEVEVDCAAEWLESLPLPRFFVEDAGKYLTAGLVCVDAGPLSKPADWSKDLGIRRLLFLGRNRFAIRVDSLDLSLRIAAAAQGLSPLNLSVAVGVHPLVLLASQFSGKWFSSPKLGTAGGFLGEALPMVRCVSNGVRVPAHAEFVLEGHIEMGMNVAEGPVHELSGCLGPSAQAAVFCVDKVTHRSSWSLPIICPGSSEQRILSALPRELALAAGLRAAGHEVARVCFPLAACARFHAVIAIKKRFADEGVRVIRSAFERFPDLKRVTVVDDDVDVVSGDEVEWAMATRFQAATGLTVHEMPRPSLLDPSARGFSAVQGLGFDATRPMKK